jgi:hypothetical protein
VRYAHEKRRRQEPCYTECFHVMWPASGIQEITQKGKVLYECADYV